MPTSHINDAVLQPWPIKNGAHAIVEIDIVQHNPQIARGIICQRRNRQRLSNRFEKSGEFPTPKARLMKTLPRCHTPIENVQMFPLVIFRPGPICPP